MTVLELRVWEAYTRDVGRGVARIGFSSMDALGASTDDILEIRGKHRSVAKCLTLYTGDDVKNNNVIKLDGLVRGNVGVDVGDSVSVRKIRAMPAENVIVTSVEGAPPIDERYLTDALEGIPLIQDDYIATPHFDGRLTFKVLRVTPASDASIVTKKTKFQIALRGPDTKNWSEEDEARIKKMRPDHDKPYPEDTGRHLAFALEEIGAQLSRIADALEQTHDR